MIKESARYMKEDDDEDERVIPSRKEFVTVKLGTETNPTTWKDYVQPVIDEVNSYANPETNMGDLLYSEETVDLLNQFLVSFNQDHTDNAEGEHYGDDVPDDDEEPTPERYSADGSEEEDGRYSADR